MKEQKYEKNITSYCDVVKAGRKARALESIAKQFDELSVTLSLLVYPEEIPKCTRQFKSEVWSLYLKASRKYSELFDKHIALLEGE